MGKSVQKITDKVSLIASKNTWIEGLAIQQLKKTSELPSMNLVAGMPDLHPGRGYPIGAAFHALDRVYPALVGNDIGCGMALWQTSTKLAKLNLLKLERKLKHVEMPLDDAWLPIITRRKEEKRIINSCFDNAFGTIGGGNHFAEFQAIEDVFNQQAIDGLGLDRKRLQLLVHSGSRGLGQSILLEHVTKYSHGGLLTDSKGFGDYISKHDEAVRWAELNRELIALRFIDAINASGTMSIDVNHNLVTAKKVANQNGWLHRKGATPSDQRYVVIPGSRGDYTYLVKPINAYTQSSNLFSLAHGAGRKWKRGECQGRLSHKYKREDMINTALGSRVVCGSKELLYDEAPQAYKSSESVISDMLNAGLIELVAKLRPVLTFKTNGSCGG